MKILLPVNHSHIFSHLLSCSQGDIFLLIFHSLSNYGEIVIKEGYYCLFACQQYVCVKQKYKLPCSFNLLLNFIFLFSVEAENLDFQFLTKTSYYS